ncbi:IreB family regulatory phosphoprotein [Christensenellaceae bacterium NSJ-44]|jgi:uncharacterized protein (UPF0297 family)|uniref:UPF0297 protein H8699_06280 n=1 Tax=Luoshenia tenuis TaxID=2763654 RepID=A0A926CZZ1_9FIRM|nr:MULTISPECIES: IreB family regulatory phosphoprotein [Clostridia]MBC8529029.1 IreB family regulatory phosphoprotein [Luoshenia tenuis]SCJ14644.1 Uncharacterized protein conserved in bacteria [uncultured Clostridium sp.]
MSEFNDTIQFQVSRDDEATVRDIMTRVYVALREKGYDPVNQIVGYIISGDPTYITSHQNARYLIRRLERDEILEYVVKFYLDSLHIEEN